MDNDHRVVAGTTQMRLLLNYRRQLAQVHPPTMNEWLLSSFVASPVHLTIGIALPLLVNRQCSFVDLIEIPRHKGLD